MRPIAGTRPRAADQASDLALEQELRADEKERAEHVMLVDLARNDLGRVCRPGTVKVEDFMRVERYSHVMHLVSDVTGELAEGVTSFDVLTASFPAGTVSGSPKVRAMEIIDDLERHRRGPYAGCVGYFDFSGNLDTCITIRTCVFVGDVAYCQAGAGVVADSVPEREERETEAKARALLAAVAAAEALPGARGAELGSRDGPAERAEVEHARSVLLAGVLLVVLGAGRSWAGLQAAVSVPSLGSTRVGSTNLTGNDLAPLSGLALLALVLVVAIAVTRGRGRWLVGVALLVLAVMLLAQTSAATAHARSEAERRARQGEVAGVPAGGDLRVTSPRSGPLLALTGGALLLLAGAETLRRGSSWPALGAAFRAPQDRPAPSSTEGGEPPWEGD